MLLGIVRGYALSGMPIDPVGQGRTSSFGRGSDWPKNISKDVGGRLRADARLLVERSEVQVAQYVANYGRVTTCHGSDLVKQRPAESRCSDPAGENTGRVLLCAVLRQCAPSP